MPRRPTKPSHIEKMAIGDAVHPGISEYLSEYVLVGFSADKAEPVIIRTKSDIKTALAINTLLIAAIQQNA